MFAVQEEQNINLIFTEIGQGRGLLMSIISWQHKSGFHGRPEMVRHILPYPIKTENRLSPDYVFSQRS